MTIAEAKRFYETDRQEYIPEKNREFMAWLYEKLQKGYNPYLDLESIKDLIQKIKTWYEMKYPNRELEYRKGVISTEFEGINNISENMDFEQLRYRLHHSELETLDCKYRSNSGYCQPDWGGYDQRISDSTGWIDFIGFKVDAQLPSEMKIVRMMSATAIGGLISPYEMTRLDDFLPTVPTEFITIKDLIDIIRNSSNMTSTDLDKIEFTHETDLELRTKIFDMINLALIYSKETIPEYGQERARKFSEDVNAKYNISISTPDITELILNTRESTDRIERLRISNLKRKVKKIEKKNN